MLNFFRKIRQKLLAEGKLRNYFFYAIGEILLVVIGILIALQINNWNKEREERLLEIKILKEISSNLKLDLDEIRDDISYMDDINKACGDIISFLKTDAVPSDAFYINAGILRVTPHFDPNKSGYGLLDSKGLEIISNDSLRSSISLLYEQSYSYYYRFEQERIEFKTFHMEPKLLEYFTMQFRTDLNYYAEFQISSEDYKKLRNDETFQKLVSAIAFENNGVLYRAQKIERRILTILSQIKNELEKKQE